MGREGGLYLGGVWRGGECEQNTMSENLKELIKISILVKAENIAKDARHRRIR